MMVDTSQITGGPALGSQSLAADAQGRPAATDPRQQAGQDASIQKRMEKHPESKDARLDNALDETMDASDPASITQPGRSEPAPSSGYDEEAERQRDA